MEEESEKKKKKPFPFCSYCAIITYRSKRGGITFVVIAEKRERRDSVCLYYEEEKRGREWSHHQVVCHWKKWYPKRTLL